MSDPLWLNDDSASPGTVEYAANELRQAMAVLLPFDNAQVAGGFHSRTGQRPTGADNTLHITDSGATWNIRHTAAVVSMDTPADANSSASYLVAISGSGSIDPADGTNDRIDAVDLQIQDDDQDASGFRRARLVYTAGTPGASPSAPAALDNSLRMGTIFVPSSGTVTATQTAQFTVSNGGVIPVRDSTELPGTALDGAVAYNQATGEFLLREGGAWEPLAKTGGGFGIVGYDSLTSETAVSGTSSPGTLLCSTSVAVTTDRRYRVTGKTRWRVDSAGERLARLGILADGATIGTSQIPVSNQTAANGPMDHVSRQVFVPTSDATVSFDLYGFRQSGATSLLAAASTGVPAELLLEDIGPA